MLLVVVAVWSVVYLFLRDNIIASFEHHQAGRADVLIAGISADARAMTPILQMTTGGYRFRDLVRGTPAADYETVFNAYAQMLGKPLSLQIYRHGQLLFSSRAPGAAPGLAGVPMQALLAVQQVHGEVAASYLVVPAATAASEGFLLSWLRWSETAGVSPVELLLEQSLQHGLWREEGELPPELWLQTSAGLHAVYRHRAAPAPVAVATVADTAAAMTTPAPWPEIAPGQRGGFFAGADYWRYQPLPVPVLRVDAAGTVQQHAAALGLVRVSTLGLQQELAGLFWANLAVATMVSGLLLAMGGWLWFGRRERVTLAQQLDSGSHQMARVLELSGADHWVWDLRADTLAFAGTINPAWRAATDSGGVVSPQHLRPFIHPADHAPMCEQFTALAAGQRDILDMTFRLRTVTRLNAGIGTDTDNEAATAGVDYGWFHMLGYVCERSASGAPLQATGIVLNVQAQKDIEQALQESEQRYRRETERLQQVLAVTATAIWEMDTVTGAITVGPDWAAMLGYTLAELGPMDAARCRALMYAGDADVLDRQLLDCLLGKTPTFDCEFRMRHKDGHWIWVADNARVVARDDNGTALRVLGIHRDITRLKSSDEAVREIRKQFIQVAELLPVGISLMRDSGDMFYRNPVAQQLLQSFGAADIKAVPENPMTALAQLQQQVLHEGADIRDEVIALPHAGHQVWLRVSARRLAGSEPLAVLVYTDISELIESRNQMRQAASVFSNVSEAIIIIDPTLRMVAVNAAFTAITGFAAEEVVGRPWEELARNSTDVDSLSREIATVNQREHISGQFWAQRKNGERYAVRATITIVRDEAGQITHYISMFSDITASLNYQQQLERMAHHDALTGLPNRTLLQERLRAALEMARREQTSVAVVFIDLDGFKNINDCYGHDAGDDLLVGIASALQGSLRACDSLLRLGGDEFVAILGQLDTPAASCSVLDRLLEASCSVVDVGAHPLQVAGSMGVAFYPQECADAAGLLKRADTAMYRAKEAGKGHWYSPWLVEHPAV